MHKFFLERKSRIERSRYEKILSGQVHNLVELILTILSICLQFCRIFLVCYIHNLFNINKLINGTFIALLFASIFERRLE